MEPPQRDRAALDAFIHSQHGLFTRAQARTCGYSNYHISRRIRDGDWVTVLRQVLIDRGRAITPALRDAAALLAMPDAVLAGPSAVRTYGIQLPTAGTFVVLPRGRVRPRDMFVFHDPLPPSEIRMVDGLRVTSVERAIFDSTRILTENLALDLLVRALAEGWTTVTDFGDRIGASAGRHGVPTLVRLVQQAAAGTRTASERLAVRLLERADIPGWTTGTPIHDRWGLICMGDIVFARVRLLLDFGTAIPGSTVTVRIPEALVQVGAPDSMPAPPETTDADQDVDRVRRTNERQYRLRLAGWTVLRFTWHDLSTRPDHSVATIRNALDSCRGSSR